MEERISTLEQQVIVLQKEITTLTEIMQEQQKFCNSIVNTINVITKAVATLQDEKIKELKATVAGNESN